MIRSPTLKSILRVSGTALSNISQPRMSSLHFLHDELLHTFGGGCEFIVNWYKFLSNEHFLCIFRSDHSHLLFNMLPFPIFAISFLASIATARNLAEPAAQHLAGRAQFLGGWPLGLSTAPGAACPASNPVACSTSLVNPTCCPTGSTCVWGSGQFANYCCPTGKYSPHRD